MSNLLPVKKSCIALSMIFAGACAKDNIISSSNKMKSIDNDKVSATKNEVKLANVGFFVHPQTKAYYTSLQSQFSLKTAGDDAMSYIEISVDNEKFKKYKGPLQFDSEGAHVVRYRSVDPLANLGPTSTIKVFVDNTPPKVSVNWLGKKTTNTQSSDLVIHPDTSMAIEATDNLSGVAKIFVKLSPNQSPSDYQAPIKFHSIGPKVIWVASADNVGNLSAWQKLHFNVDNISPKVEHKFSGLFKPSKDFTYIGDQTLLTLTASDDTCAVDYIEYQINDGPIVKYTEAIPLLKEKAKIKFRAIDQVGNTSQWQTAEVQPDSIAPTIAITELSSSIKDKGIIYAKPGFALKINATDQESGLGKTFITYDQNSFSNLEKEKLTFSEPGVHHVIFKAEDSVGNTYQTEVLSIFIDSTVEESQLRPKRKLVPLGDSYITTLPNSLEIIGNDNGVGINHVEYSYDGKVFTKLSDAIDLSEWTVKKRTLYYRAIDKLGNMEKIQSINISIQNEAPSVEIFVNTGNSPQKSLSTLEDQKSDLEQNPIVK